MTGSLPRIASSTGRRPPGGRSSRFGLPVAAALLAAGCDGPQSWIAPAGVEAEDVASLFWVMLAAAALLWCFVIGAMVYASRVEPGPHSKRLAKRFVIWGGMVLPTTGVLSLLVVGLLMLEDIVSRPGDFLIEAKGEQWWWRFAYPGPDGEPVPAPNELRLPVGRTAEVLLAADDVIHSFWAPSLAGKRDMIPGRVNRVTLTPTATGYWRGACAEFCGEAHAQMNFPIVVMEPAEWEAWVAAQAAPARPPATEREAAGLALFLESGCGACHAIRGTEAEGRVGPDLTHVGSRLTIGAGLLPTSVETLARWIAATEFVKPGVRMPSYGMLPEEEILLIAEYLASLE